MTGTWRGALLALAMCLASVMDARGGLYNPDEPDEGKLEHRPADVVKDFRMTLWNLRSIGLAEVPRENPLRRRYVLVADLAQRQPLERFSLEQKIVLSATYLRRGNPAAALQLLRQLARAEPENLLVLENLTTAYHRAGELEAANDTMRQLKKAWPEQWTDLKEPQQKFLERVGWHQALYEWNRKVELYYAKLLRARFLEKSRKSSALKDETLDSLFDDGKTPGPLTAVAKAKLPRDAAEIVQQLLVWLPDDNRLYWLLGEIYAAQGTAPDLLAAYAIFDDLVDPQKRQYRPRELVAHYRRLQERVATLPAEGSAKMADLEARLDVVEQKRAEAAPAFDWRNLLVGFAAGFVLALFGFWQLREIRRRRHKRQAASR
jgi:tetratricopeptide (TPR) repeat protein